MIGTATGTRTQHRRLGFWLSGPAERQKRPCEREDGNRSERGDGGFLESAVAHSPPSCQPAALALSIAAFACASDSSCGTTM